MEEGFYTKISKMGPMMPTDPAGELDDLAIELIRKSAVSVPLFIPLRIEESWN